MLELVPGTLVSVAATLVGVLLALLFVVRLGLARERGGVLVGALAFLAVPCLVLTVGSERHLGTAKTDAFCMSCHEMHPYGASLRPTDTLAGAHHRNRWVPKDTTCYACHTRYTMFGGLAAKMSGLHHMWVHYFGELRDPLALYEPYSNRECLHCHDGGDSFEQAAGHAEKRAAFRGDAEACMKCHGPAHGVEPGAVTAARDGTRRFSHPGAPAGGGVR
jgi:nitrate/TMAO reductase-like tetraheme cytochrome c subunit